MSTHQDDQQQFALGLLAILITLVIAAVVGTVVVKRTGTKPQPAAAVASAPEAVVAEVASVRVEGDVVKFYFVTAQADVAPGAAEALAQIVAAVGQGKTVLVSGFHDATGDAAQNEELAKRRALSVRDALAALGVSDDKIQLQQPQQTEGSGNNAEARRVEVTLAP